MSEIWAEIAPQVTDRISIIGLESLCCQVATQREARRRIDHDGLVVSDSRGNPIAHPALAVEKSAQAEIRKWIEKYGKTRR
jgi:hypothetical protein